jgi:hypothetical protein
MGTTASVPGAHRVAISQPTVHVATALMAGHRVIADAGQVIDTADRIRYVPCPPIARPRRGDQ